MKTSILLRVGGEGNVKTSILLRVGGGGECENLQALSSDKFDDGNDVSHDDCACRRHLDVG